MPPQRIDEMVPAAIFIACVALTPAAAPRNVTVGDAILEIMSSPRAGHREDEYHGIGSIWINGSRVRSGRLPWHVMTETWSGALGGDRDGVSDTRFASLEVASASLIGVEQSSPNGMAKVHVKLAFVRQLTQQLLDMNLDPIHDSTDWGSRPYARTALATANLTIVLQPATYTVTAAGVPLEFGGFKYHYEYASGEVPVYWLLVRGSFEIGGDATGATVFSQTVCTSPVSHLTPATSWTTDCIMAAPNNESSYTNKRITHMFPRWADTQAFDFQFKDTTTLLGVFEGVDLIRSMQRKDAGSPELKVVDKYIFDEALAYTTPAKMIVMRTDSGLLGATAAHVAAHQENVWTWVFDDVEARARGEFGLETPPVEPRVDHDYWTNWTIAKYQEDMIPAVEAMGIKSVFMSNVHKTDYTELNLRHNPVTEQSKGRSTWSNICQPWELEVADTIGGNAGLAKFVDRCNASGIKPFSWTNNAQSVLSPLQQLLPGQSPETDWFVYTYSADSVKVAGGYTNSLAIWSFAIEEAREYWVSALKRDCVTTGLCNWFLDSFSNMQFYPVSFKHGRPTTLWRQSVEAHAELQKHGIRFMMESLGPWAETQRGKMHDGFNSTNMFILYTLNYGQAPAPGTYHDPALYYRMWAHKVNPTHPLYIGDVKINTLFTSEHKRALQDYCATRSSMVQRFLQADGSSVLWLSADAVVLTIWNFVAREWTGSCTTMRDVTANVVLPRKSTKAKAHYPLLPYHTYQCMCAARQCQLDDRLKTPQV